MRRPVLSALTLIAATLAAAPVLAEEPAHKFELAGLEVLHPWTPATEDDTALVYMELHNEGADEILLTGAESPQAASAALVGIVLKDGAPAPEVLPEVAIAPDTHLDLEPNVLAFQLSGLTGPLAEGSHFDLTLQTSVGPLEIEVEVEEAGASQHGHAGHNH